jgi:sulfur carrier protein
MNETLNPNSDTITIMANGQSRIIKASSTITDFLEDLNVKSTHVVVQLDGMIVPRSEFDRIVLQPDCKLEIVTMVGGG